MSYGKYSDTCLRDISYNIYDEFKDKIPENRRRAEHFYTERERVKRGANTGKKEISKSTDVLFLSRTTAQSTTLKQVWQSL